VTSGRFTTRIGGESDGLKASLFPESSLKNAGDRLSRYQLSREALCSGDEEFRDETACWDISNALVKLAGQLAENMR
jgi:hypothetical protein